MGAIVGVILSVVLVLTAFLRLNLDGTGPLLTPRFSFFQFLHAIPSQLPWLLPFVVLSGAILPLRALQWRWTLSAPVPFKERYHVVAIGAFVHNALPGKLGDIFRAFLLARTQRQPFVAVLGSVAVCKLLEFAALMLLVALSLLGPFALTLQRFAGSLRMAAIACVALVAVVMVVAHFAQPVAGWLERQDRFPRARLFLAHLGDGLGAARSVPGMLVALFFSIGPVLAPAAGYGLALHFIGVKGGLFAGTVVLGALALGQGTPGIPSGLGLYYLVTSWAARSLGAAETDAAAFAALTHLGTFATQTVLGGLSVWVRKIRWADLRQRRDLAASAARAMTEEPSAAPVRA